MRQRISPIIPGLLAAASVAAVARMLDHMLPGPGEVILAMAGGLAIASTAKVPRSLAPGMNFASQRVLRVGIVLLGARLSVGTIADIGGAVGLLAVILVALVFLTGWLIGRSAGVGSSLAALIAIGTAVCGNSAILATAPLLKAKPRDIGYAIATITFFGGLALMTYPLLGRAMGMTDAEFGMWVGLAINDTSQVVGAGAAYSPEARDVATVVKLMRNLMIAPLVMAIALLAARRGARTAGGAMRGGALRAFPLFVVGFLAMSGLRSWGAIDEPMAAWMGTLARACIVLAVAAVGLSTDIRELRQTGIRPLGLGLLLGLTLATTALVAVVLLGRN